MAIPVKNSLIFISEWIYQSRKKKGVQLAHPARGLQHPFEECTQPHAQLGRERGKGLQWKCCNFWLPLPLR
jgi:hypothetical protein